MENSNEQNATKSIIFLLLLVLLGYLAKSYNQKNKVLSKALRAGSDADITKTRLFKYTEKLITEKLKIFRQKI